MTDRRPVLTRWRRRGWWIQALLVVVIFSVDLWLVWEHDRVTAVDLDDALAEFHAGQASTASPTSSAIPHDPRPPVHGEPPSTTAAAGERSARATTAPSSEPPRPPQVAPAAPGTSRPGVGVYTYWTHGQETFGPARHDYPGQTHAVVRVTDCGWSFDHRVVEEHTDAHTYCIGDDARLVAWDATREFLRLSLDEHYACTGQPWIPSEVGGESSVACTTDDEDRADLTISRRPPEPITIGGQGLDAIRVDVRAVISGNPDGVLDARLWLDPATGLRLREVRTVEAQVEAGGTSEYHEEAEFLLESLTPRQ